MGWRTASTTGWSDTTLALEALARRKTMVTVSARSCSPRSPCSPWADFRPDDTSKLNINVKAPRGPALAMARLTEQTRPTSAGSPISRTSASVGQSEGHEIRGTNEVAFLARRRHPRPLGPPDVIISAACHALQVHDQHLFPVGGFGEARRASYARHRGPDLDKLKGYAAGVAETLKTRASWTWTPASPTPSPSTAWR